MGSSDSKNVEKALQTPEIHQQWTDSYRTSENEKFYEQAFDSLAKTIKASEKALFLDVGCGSGAHSIRLARLGYSVLAVDFSEEILNVAEENLKNLGLKEKVDLRRENLLSLSFDDNTFDYILCWGVLMHIPDIDVAISELSRVLKGGGNLVVSEGNMHSLQSVSLRIFKRIIGGAKESVKRTEAGLEHWCDTPSGTLLSREADIGWIKRAFAERELSVKKHVAGQFTELYSRFSSKWIRMLLHRFNSFWFHYVKIPCLAFGNIMIFEKRK